MLDSVLDTVKNLLKLELGIYGTLRKMVSRELEAIILDKDMEELLSILQEKQELISRLQLLADTWLDAFPSLGLAEVRGTSGFWEKLGALFSGEESAEFDQILSETRAAAENLMVAEAKVQEELEKHVQQLRDKMLQMTQGRSAFVNYAKMGGSYIDSGQ
ncbi:MAG: flagellar protein FlgN [Synergistaceae bacterium]|nr:flagellar protein FlgN [Synergistaceae bacterium]